VAGCSISVKKNFRQYSVRTIFTVYLPLCLIIWRNAVLLGLNLICF
jgi:hypothetical protein